MIPIPLPIGPQRNLPVDLSPKIFFLRIKSHGPTATQEQRMVAKIGHSQQVSHSPHLPSPRKQLAKRNSGSNASPNFLKRNEMKPNHPVGPTKKKKGQTTSTMIRSGCETTMGNVDADWAQEESVGEGLKQFGRS